MNATQVRKHADHSSTRDELRDEAARKLDRAAAYDSLLSGEWETDWPAYWRETGSGNLVAVEE